jgi:hypothetical protein
VHIKNIVKVHLSKAAKGVKMPKNRPEKSSIVHHAKQNTKIVKNIILKGISPEADSRQE